MIEAELATEKLVSQLKSQIESNSTHRWRFEVPMEVVKLWTEEHWVRFSSRQKQIELGHLTEEYKAFESKVAKYDIHSIFVLNSRNKRDKSMPKSPINDLKVSKKLWTQKISQWRRALHSYVTSN